MNTKYIANALRESPVTLVDGREGYIAPVQWSDVSCAATGAHIGSVGTQPGLIRIRLGSYHLTVVPLGDI
jgi:hypothetical protein